jgi:cell division transport system permease protein
VRALRYSLDEALVSLRRAGRSTILSIGTVAVAFLTLGGFALVTSNLQQLIEQWASAAEMSVFLRDDIDAATRTALDVELRSHAAVSGVEFVSKEQALARFKSEFPELVDAAATNEGNPFPASFELQLRADDASSRSADILASELAARSGVADVRYDRQWLARVMALVRGIRLTGTGIAGVLVLGAAFTVAAVVRLSLFARRDEIEIMRLVGAPFAFLRGPSVAEGTIIGGVGAVVALLALYLIYQSFKTRLSEIIAALVSQGEVRFIGAGDATLMILAALALGGLTGVVVSRAVR